jgi:hypothetical protein
VAQGVSVIGGATFATLRGLDDVALDQRTGAFGGLSFLLPLGGGALALQPEALLVAKGARAPRTATADLAVDLLEVPLLLRLSPAPGAALSPHLYAGPSFGLRVRCRLTGRDARCDDVPEVNARTVEVGGVVGGGVTLALGALRPTLGVRYGFGLSPLADVQLGAVRESARTGTWALYAAVGLGGRR